MKRYKSVLILILGCLIPAIFTATLPYALPMRLRVNRLSSSHHSSNLDLPKLFIITLNEGSQYTITVDTNWGMDIVLKISDSPYMIMGSLVNGETSGDEIMRFTATRSGIYFIKVEIRSGSGFFDIRVDSGFTNMATGVNVRFFDVSYILVLILPSVFIILIGFILMRLRRRKKLEREASRHLGPEIIETISEKPDDIYNFFNIFVNTLTKQTMWYQGTRMEIMELGPREQLKSKFQMLPTSGAEYTFTVTFAQSNDIINVLYDYELIFLLKMPFKNKMRRMAEKAVNPVIVNLVIKSLNETKELIKTGTMVAKVDDPLERLKKKFVEGEISEEEYLHKKKLLEHEN